MTVSLESVYLCSTISSSSPVAALATSLDSSEASFDSLASSSFDSSSSFTSLDSSVPCRARIASRPQPDARLCVDLQRYSRSIYQWTMLQWDMNRADIERRAATVALNALALGMASEIRIARRPRKRMTE